MSPGQGHWGNCNSNGNGAHDGSYFFDRGVATATAAIDRLQRGNGNGGDRLQWHWGNCNCNGTGAQEQGQQDSDCNGAMGRWQRCVCFMSRINVMDCG
jgi:hypothetical protein